MTEDGATRTGDHDVADRVIIVTGAGRGVGRGIAHHLAAHGAVVVVGEFVERRLARVLTELGEPHFGQLCDVRRRDDIDALVGTTLERFGRVDALVSNAVTYGGPRPFTEITDEDLDLVYTSGVKAALWGMQAVYPPMRDAGWGRIVNVGSGAGILGLPGFGAYSAAKEAIRGLTRTAAREWARDGIVVNAFCPASFEPRAGGATNPFSEEAYKTFFHQHPMGRAGDAADDIGPVVRFLCSDGCRYMTGESLMVDGGAYMWA